MRTNECAQVRRLMLRRVTVVIAAAVTAAFAFVATASATGTLDQSQTVANDLQPIPGSPDFPSYRVAQIFTAGSTGYLDQVDLFLIRQFDPGDLVVEVRSAPNGVPSDTVLAAASLSQSGVPTGGTSAWASVPFNVPAESTAGAQYAIVVHAPHAVCGGDCWLWWGAYDDPYAGGQALFSIDGATWSPSLSGIDFTFKTYVTGSAFPTSKDECRAGGWRDFPQLKNQGNCIAFVAKDTD